MKTAGIIVAAGLSSRMGDFKPLLPFRSSTIIENTIDTMKQAGIETIVVVIGHNKELMEEVLGSCNVITIYNPTYATSDMMTSIKIGLEEIFRVQESKDNIEIENKEIENKEIENKETHIEALFILPGDMPAISPTTLIKIQNYLKYCNAKIIFPTIQGRKKHPPLIRVELLQEIYHYQGNMGLRGALEPYEMDTAFLEVDDYGCTVDTDTPEDYKRLLEYGK